MENVNAYERKGERRMGQKKRKALTGVRKALRRYQKRRLRSQWKRKVTKEPDQP